MLVQLHAEGNSEFIKKNLLISWYVKGLSKISKILKKFSNQKKSNDRIEMPKLQVSNRILLIIKSKYIAA